MTSKSLGLRDLRADGGICSCSRWHILRQPLWTIQHRTGQGRAAMPDVPPTPGAYAAGGPYTDPTVSGPPLTGPASPTMRALFRVPGSFEILSGQPVDGDPGGAVVMRWPMRGAKMRLARRADRVCHSRGCPGQHVSRYQMSRTNGPGGR
jgi:hypothetical protein